MKPVLKLSVILFASFLFGCSGGRNAKRGCPTNDANLGAERVLAGEGKKKPSKFKVKDMDKTYTQ